MARGEFGPAGYGFYPTHVRVLDGDGLPLATYAESGAEAPPNIDNAGRVSFWIEAGTYTLELTHPTTRAVETHSVTVVGAVPPPNAASGALSAKKFAAVRDFTYTTPRYLPAGQGYDLQFNDTALTILKGAAYTGTGTALDLDVTVDPDVHQLVVPDDDAIYDVYCTVYVTCDAADNGKMVGFDVNSDNGFAGDNEAYFPVVGGHVVATVASTLYVFAGSGPQLIDFFLDGSMLSMNATVTRIHPLVIVKR